mgnify:FL=1
MLTPVIPRNSDDTRHPRPCLSIDEALSSLSCSLHWSWERLQGEEYKWYSFLGVDWRHCYVVVQPGLSDSWNLQIGFLTPEGDVPKNLEWSYTQSFYDGLRFIEKRVQDTWWISYKLLREVSKVVYDKICSHQPSYQVVWHDRDQIPARMFDFQGVDGNKYLVEIVKGAWWVECAIRVGRGKRWKFDDPNQPAYTIEKALERLEQLLTEQVNPVQHPTMNFLSHDLLVLLVTWRFFRLSL